ncbi:MFS transporter [Zavarzinia sp.]|uniref:MFS transporter n=1 Tax=Zavarzinia sp. TaxID=2027920 RepID=UPI003567B35F
MALTERGVVAVVGAVQFVNILDFMMVMPLGPDFAVALGIDPAHLGIVAGAYTVAACLSGLLGSLVLDRFARRSALVVSLAGLGLGTIAGSFAFDLTSLVAARLVAGLFGGPATGLSLSVIADLIPEERRGRALGAVMGAFAIAAVAGVPAGLELARLADWRLPFFAVGAAGLTVAVLARFTLPPGHRVAAVRPSFRGYFRRPAYLLAFAGVGAANMQAFLIFPSTTAFLQFNLGFPRDDLGLLYMIGGGLSLVGMRLTGRIVDRLGTSRVNVVATIVLALLLFGAFVIMPPPAPMLVLFPCFMLAMSARNVATQTLMTKVPIASERAGFMSLSSACQHLTASAGAGISSLLLTTDTAGRLVGMPTLAFIAIFCAALVPVVQATIEVLIKRERMA